MDWTLIGFLLLLGVLMYFFMIRPGKKQQQKQQEMMNSLAVGTRVMLSSGIYGTIRHLGEKQAVIEISPGVDLTILRAAIRQVITAEEEEFEYSDEAETDGPAPEMAAYEADLASAFAPEPEVDSQPETDNQAGESKDSSKSDEK